MTARSSISILLALSFSAFPALAQRRRGNAPPVQRQQLVRPGAPQQKGTPPPQPQQQPAQSERAPQDQQQPGMRFRLHGPGPHAGDWLRGHEGMPPEQRLKALEQDPAYQQLPEKGKERLRNQLQRFDSLPPQRQQQILQRMENFEHLTPDQKQEARGLFQQFQNLPSDRRQELMRGFRELRGLSPEDRKKTIDSGDYKSRFSDQERGLLKGMGDLGLVPGRPHDDD